MDRRGEDATLRGSSIFSPTQTLDHHRRLLSDPPPLPDPDPPVAAKYIECMKIHAVSKGRHLVDGCREFMPSGEDGTMEALRCAVCDCHRNFHRREVKGMHQQINHSINRSPQKIDWRIRKYDEEDAQRLCSGTGVKRQMLTYQGDTGADSHEIRANLRLKTPAHSEPEEACSKAHHTYKKMCANIALDYYNDENDTRFELLGDETLDSYSFADSSGSWIHCSFNAKEDSSINEFFAELQYVYPLGPAVTTCQILVEGETQVGCENCKSVTHPVGYRGGFPGNIDHASNAMSDDDEKDSPAATVENSDKALSKANHKHNETRANIALDYYNKYDATDHFLTYTSRPVLKKPTYTPRAPTLHDEGMFCNHALDHYNKTNGTKFVYVDNGSTEWTSFCSSWIHICFSASYASAAVKLFFAEIFYDGNKPIVTVCKILEGETQGGCEWCVYKLLTHPVVGYHVELVTIDPKDSYKETELFWKMMMISVTWCASLVAKLLVTGSEMPSSCASVGNKLEWKCHDVYKSFVEEFLIEDVLHLFLAPRRFDFQPLLCFREFMKTPPPPDYTLLLSLSGVGRLWIMVKTVVDGGGCGRKGARRDGVRRWRGAVADVGVDGIGGWAKGGGRGDDEDDADLYRSDEIGGLGNEEDENRFSQI